MAGSPPPQAGADAGSAAGTATDTATTDGSDGKLPGGMAGSGAGSPAAGSSGNSGTGSSASGNSGSGSPGSGSFTVPEEPAAGGQAALPGHVQGATPVYFVALDDGGSTGVRFGCNDSLVAVSHAPVGAEEPLHAALGILLGGGQPPNGLYNSLHGSSLQYVSAYFDGTTVVVNLTGTVRPGGTCDIPRLEAQLTHTAVSAVGAARAEFYVDGRRLADVLSLR
jgi:hypothetical protein